MTTEEMNCPHCEGDCYREEVDVGVGTIYGPWGCMDCGWSSASRYDSRNGAAEAEQDYPGRYVSPAGVAYSRERMREEEEAVIAKLRTWKVARR